MIYTLIYALIYTLIYTLIHTLICTLIYALIYTLIGLSKERPILGDNPKAHNLKIWQISGEIQWIS